MTQGEKLNETTHGGLDSEMAMAVAREVLEICQKRVEKNRTLASDHMNLDLIVKNVLERITRDRVLQQLTDRDKVMPFNKESFKVKEYASYKDLVKTPEAHVEFLRVIGQEIDDPKGVGSLHARLSSSIRVKDDPFSQVAHLTALESNSDGWDMDEVADPVKVEIAQLSAKVKGTDPGYDVPHFTAGFEWMIRDLRERGVSVEGGLHFEKEKEAVSGVDYEAPSL